MEARPGGDGRLVGQKPESKMTADGASSGLGEEEICSEKLGLTLAGDD